TFLWSHAAHADQSHDVFRGLHGSARSGQPGQLPNPWYVHRIVDDDRLLARHIEVPNEIFLHVARLADDPIEPTVKAAMREAPEPRPFLRLGVGADDDGLSCQIA